MKKSSPKPDRSVSDCSFWRKIPDGKCLRFSDDASELTVQTLNRKRITSPSLTI